MERLTERSENGTAVYCHPAREPERWTENRVAVLERCCKYEDTGLTPEEIMDGKLLTRWIPVAEKLPGTERILITNGEFVKEGYCRPDGVWKYGAKEDEQFSNLSSKPIVAWMPLPEPYAPQIEDLTEEKWYRY